MRAVALHLYQPKRKSYAEQTIEHYRTDVEKSQELGQELNHLLSNFQLYYQNLRGFFLVKERELLETASEAQDEGTSDLITPIIAEQEKTGWMLRAWLN